MSDVKQSTVKQKTAYREVADQASKSLADRQAIVPGRNGKMVVPRCYHLKPEKAEGLIKAMSEKGRFVAPFRRGGAYWGVIEALAVLGTNKRHLFGKVAEKMQEVMSDDAVKDAKSGKTAWEKFVGRAPKSQKSPRDTLGKILQNIEVLQRLGGAHPYAYKIAQMGACINLYKTNEAGDEGIYIELQTGIEDKQSIVPINERRDRRSPATSVLCENHISGMTAHVETDDKAVEVVSLSGEKTDTQDIEADLEAETLA